MLIAKAAGIPFPMTSATAKLIVPSLQYHDKEIDLASRLQQTMLKTDIPQFDSIQIGVISVAAQLFTNF
jgi:serine phosphatase RsbU (regulator of sigma subunit)